MDEIRTDSMVSYGDFKVNNSLDFEKFMIDQKNKMDEKIRKIWEIINNNKDDYK